MKKTSDFTPEPGRDKHLDSFIEAVKKEVLHGLKDNVKPNISKKEQNAIKTLLNDATVVIRQRTKVLEWLLLIPTHTLWKKKLKPVKREEDSEPPLQRRAHLSSTRGLLNFKTSNRSKIKW